MPAINQKTALQLQKQKLLDALQETESLTDALEFCGVSKSALCSFLFTDKTFQKSFDKIINLKLEIALIDTALKSRAANILSFSLINRLPKKYNKTKKEQVKEKQENQNQQIVYVQEN